MAATSIGSVKKYGLNSPSLTPCYMIQKIDIDSFGLFKNFDWDTHIGRGETFRRLNIIYGRNYSGKTTLSRILRCMEHNSLHVNYQDANFIVTLPDSTYITQASFASPYKIRVYNSDFVRENLSWLSNTDGTIKPFTILGAVNVELDRQIKEIEQQLGSIESSSGLSFQFSEKQKSVLNSKVEYQKLVNDLDDKLRKRANEKIKIDTNLFLSSPLKKAYTITDIKSELDAMKGEYDKFVLTTEFFEEKRKVLSEIPKQDIASVPEIGVKLSDHIHASNDLLQKKIRLSDPINELMAESVLQEWVRQGMSLNRGKDKCGFCGNVISNDLWEKLEAHFNKESEDLRKDIKKLLVTLDQSKQNLPNFVSVIKDQFYVSLVQRFEGLAKEWSTAVITYGKTMDKLIGALGERERDIFNEKAIPEVQDVTEVLSDILMRINQLIIEHNGKTATLSLDQQSSRDALRKSSIAQFLIDIEYQNQLVAIETARQLFIQEEAGLKPLSEEIEKLLEQKRGLEAQGKDESKGAELVNQHLTHFFGHKELKLIAEGTSPNMAFKINRDGSLANNLSEGECSLISFCYFVAKMEDELSDETTRDKLIIYIDDPISSLDGNHIFFMFSLIESIIARPKKYGQLFISTHNLDFLKYLKRLTAPNYKPQLNSKDKPDLRYFIIERKNKEITVLKDAPAYLKTYVTEFNYLFSFIYKCSLSDNQTISQDFQYNFGNNMRKFLEAYLFYKYPTHKLNNDARIRKFFPDEISFNLINRVINEYSHIGEHFDRGMRPIDLDEISGIAKIVMQRIQTDDAAQFQALVESVED